jgi:hypothetical protein
MRRFFITLMSMLVLVSTAFVLAQDPSKQLLHHDHQNNQGNDDNQGNQDQDDHDDHGPVQSGYAVVTSAASSNVLEIGTGLVVFETFGMRHGSLGTSQAGILPPGLTTNAVMFVDSSGRLSKKLAVAIVNPNSSNQNVTLTLRKNDGTQLGTTTITVPSLHQTSTFMTQLFSGTTVPSDVTGTLAITSSGSSNLPVSVIGLRFRGSNFSTLPVTDLSGNPGPLPTLTPGVGGAGAVLLPQFAAGGGWATELVLMNTNTKGSLTARVDLFKPDGTPLSTTLNGQTASSFTNLMIPAGGVLVLAPRNRDGDDDF